jgi:hypothetical protein
MVNIFLKAANELHATDDHLLEYIPYIMKLVISCEEEYVIQARGSLSLKYYIMYKHEEIVKKNQTADILKLINFILQPTTREEVALFAGNIMMLASHCVSLSPPPNANVFAIAHGW